MENSHHLGLNLAGQRGKILDFNHRLEIAIDVAHGLTYLHLYAGKENNPSSYILLLFLSHLLANTSH